jgi:release factor glutamine methyltransferase
VTVLEAIQKSTDFLARKSVDSPRLQTELLLAHLLHLPRMKLYLNFDRALTAGEVDALRELVKRRGQREPLQHLTGSTSFCGYEMQVNRRVLVPRPETELLAECGWNFLGGRPAPATALDFGTGSGCLAIALAAKCPAAQVTALEVSEPALEVARTNAEKNSVAGQIRFLSGDGLAALPPDSTFDLILGNPPYIPTAEIPTLQPEVRDFDPHAALDGGADGLNFYRMLAAGAAARLRPGGKIMLEFGDGQAGAVRQLFEQEKWIVEAVKADYSQRDRIIIAGC